MNDKDYEPIKFEFFQSDMEKIMYQIDKNIDYLILHNEDKETIKQWTNIKEDLQHKIDIHKERGEWV